MRKPLINSGAWAWILVLALAASIVVGVVAPRVVHFQPREESSDGASRLIR